MLDSVRRRRRRRRQHLPTNRLANQSQTSFRASLDGGGAVCITLGHMANMADKHGKNLKMFFSSRTIILKLGMKHRGVEDYKVYIIHGPEMTLTYLLARLTWVVYAFSMCMLRVVFNVILF